MARLFLDSKSSLVFDESNVNLIPLVIKLSLNKDSRGGISL